MKKVSKRNMTNIASNREQNEAVSLSEKGAKEIWIVMAFNEALLQGWQTGKIVKETNFTRPGFFFNEQEAVEAALANAQDLCEAGMNKYAVVYPIEEGIDMCCFAKERQHWFMYDPELDKYQEVARLDTGCVLLDF